MSETEVSNDAEYDFVDKSSWGQGEWLNEPDKITWTDPETGYSCIVLRGPVGSFCGYVGVPIYHPAYGLSYNGSTQHDHDQRSDAFLKALRNNVDKSKPFLDRIGLDKLPETPVVPNIGDKISEIRVHGGLTYSGGPHKPTKEMWENYKLQAFRSRIEAAMFPHGDSAEFLKEWGPFLDDYEAWSKQVILKTIGSENYDDENWYFGFDCSHHLDLSPKLEATLKLVGSYSSHTHLRDVYRNISYVKKEVVSLAQQLKQLAP